MVPLLRYSFSPRDEIMAPGGALSDPDDIKWTWLGQGTEKGSYTYYRSAQVVRISDRAKRVFETGDTVYVANDEGLTWVAQVVEMFQIGGQINDDECQVVEDNASALMRMRCTLRWFYNSDDESLTASKRISPNIPTAVEREIYFSDHVENGTSNSLEVIEGRAFLCASEVEMNCFHNSHPANYWEGDTVRLVRCFYGYNAGRPPPIRELGKGELDVLLKNPSKDPDLYNRTRMTLYGPHRAVMKGTGAKKRFQQRSSHSPKQSHLSRKGGSFHVWSNHQFSLFSHANGASAPRYKFEDTPMRSKIVFDSSDDDSVSSTRQAHQPPVPHYKPAGLGRKNVGPKKTKNQRSQVNRIASSSKDIRLNPPPDDQFASNTFEKHEPSVSHLKRAGHTRKNTGSRTIKGKDRSQMNMIASSSSEIRPKPVKSANAAKSTQNDLRTLGNASKPGKQQKLKCISSAAPGEMEAAWSKVNDTLKTGTRGQQEFAFQQLPEMLDVFVQLMKQNDLSFDMNEKNKNSIAKIVAKQVFGNVSASSIIEASPCNGYEKHRKMS